MEEFERIQKVNNIFNNLENHIKKNVFSKNKVDVLLHHLLAMKYNTDLEWYNIGLIASYIYLNDDVTSLSSRLENDVFVNTKERWRDIYQVTNNNNISFQENYVDIKPLEILVPKVIDDSYICFYPTKVYFQSQLILNQVKSNSKYTKKSSIQDVIEEYHFDSIKKYLKVGWQEKLLENYLENFDFYLFPFADDELKTFYKSVMVAAFGGDIEIGQEDYYSLLLPETKYGNIMIYRNIYELITNFHAVFAMYLKRISETLRKRNEVGIHKDCPIRTYSGYKDIVQLNQEKAEDVRDKLHKSLQMKKLYAAVEKAGKKID